MKYRLVLGTLLLALAPAALASNTWYVNGVTGSDSNNCMSATTACKTIGHAISLASSGDTIMVAAATYTENLTLPFGLTITGAGASTTIVDGGAVAPVVVIQGGSVTLSGLTIQNGYAPPLVACDGVGGGICAAGISLEIVNCVISGNTAYANGGGIYTEAVATTILNSTVTGNNAGVGVGGGVYVIGNFNSLTINRSTVSSNVAAIGAGGIFCGGPNTLAVNNSTVNGNTATSGPGGGIWCSTSTTVTNSTISGNTAKVGTSGVHGAGLGGGIYSSNGDRLSVNSSTIAGNSAQASGASGGGIYVDASSSSATLQNTIVAGNGSNNNCAGSGTFISHGYNLSSDSTCHLTGPNDLNDTNPKLGPLQNNGGPTQTMALGNGSPAIDTGNPAGCTDGAGHLLKTDQRGAPRPDKNDPNGCDIGAYESQN